MKLNNLIARHKEVIQIASILAIFCLLILGFQFTKFDGFEIDRKDGIVLDVYNKSFPATNGGGTHISMAKVRLKEGGIANVICEYGCVVNAKIKVTVYQTINPFKQIYVHKKEPYPNF